MRIAATMKTSAARPNSHAGVTLVGRTHTPSPVEFGGLHALREHLRPVEFCRGQQIFAEGDPGDRLYVIRSGKVKIRRRCAGGRHKLVAIAGPSDIVGELAVFDPGPRTSTATAMTEVRAGWLDRNTMRVLITEKPEIAAALLQLLSRQLRRADDQLTDLVSTDVTGRVAHQLLRLARSFGTADGDTVRVLHDLTQEELAELAGASRPTLNRTLRDFDNRGWIRVENKRVLILDRDALARRMITPSISSSTYAGPKSATG